MSPRMVLQESENSYRYQLLICDSGGNNVPLVTWKFPLKQSFVISYIQYTVSVMSNPRSDHIITVNNVHVHVKGVLYSYRDNFLSNKG